MSGGLNDGWDDDEVDDLDIDMNISTFAVGNDDVENTIAETTAIMSQDDDDDANVDGWGDDDELNFDDDDDDLIQANDTPKPPTTTRAVPPPPPPQPSLQAPIQASGWDDDDDLNLDDDDDDDDDEFDKDPSTGGAPPKTSSYNVPPKDPTVASGWEDDDDLFGDDDDTLPTRVVPPPPPPKNPKALAILQQLEAYVGSLGRMMTSINAILEYEYNTPQKAEELVDYYAKRPGLANYTRTKELPRMDYQVVLPHGDVETDKEQILAQHYLPDHSLVARCANQSLLADLLHVLTGSDLVVRPQFLAICVAKRCQFTIHVEEDTEFDEFQHGMVSVKAELHLSLPTANERLDVALIQVAIVFAPHQPMVEFRVHNIVVLIKDDDEQRRRVLLEPCANFLVEMEGHLEELPGHEDVMLQNAPADIFRDAFLENTQQFFTQSTAGIKSALQQMESVVNLKSKFQRISQFIPDTEQLLAAEEEAAAYQREQQQQQQREQNQQRHQQRHQQPPPPGPPLGGMLQPPPPSSSHPPPPPMPPPSRQASDDSRPKSILGNLVSSGWRSLAKSVNIPDEDDPAIYGLSQTMPPRDPHHAPPPPQFLRPFPQQDMPKFPRPSPTPQQDMPNPASFGQPKPPRPGPPPPPPQQEVPTFSMPPHPPQQPRMPSPVFGNNQPVSSSSSNGGADGLRRAPTPPPPPQHDFPHHSKSSPRPPPPSSPSQLYAKEEGRGIETKKTAFSSQDHDTSNSLAVPSMTKTHVKPPPLPPPMRPVPTTAEASSADMVAVNDGWDEDVDIDVDEGDDNIMRPDTRNEKVVFPVDPTPKPFPLRESSKRQENIATSCSQDDALTATKAPKPKQRPLIADVQYNPDDDIIETRKRWVNPRPHRPYMTI